MRQLSVIVNCGNRWASKQPLECLPNFLSKIEKKNGKVIVFCILLWKWKYFVYRCESESIWQHLANRYLRSHSGFIHQLKMEFDTHSFISKHLQKDIKHQGGFYRIKAYFDHLNRSSSINWALRAALSCILADWGQTEYS